MASTLMQRDSEGLDEFVCRSQKRRVCVCVLQRPLSATSSSVWLPYTSIDQLLQILNETQTNSIVSLYLLSHTDFRSPIGSFNQLDCGKCS